jgi:hypothetical protein
VKKIILFLLALLPFATPAVSQAAVYYVATTGSDSAPGTQAQPWKTISHAAGVVNAGDTVIVEDGTYVETVSLTHSGTSSSPIVFKSQNKWGAIIAPSSSQVASNYGLISQITGAYNLVIDFEIVGPSDGTANSGIKVQTSGTGAAIKGNKIHHYGTANNCNGGAAVVSGGANSTVDSNFIYDYGRPLANGVCTTFDGIYFNDGNGQTMTNNIVYGGPNQGVPLQMNGEQATTPNFPSNNTIANNTVFNAQGDAVYELCWQPGSNCAGNKLINNIFYAVNLADPGAIIYISTGGSGTWGANTYTNNLVFASVGGNHLAPGQTVTETVTANPLFVNYTGDPTGDYHLQSGSPAINAGTVVGAPGTDFDGNTQTSPPTIGALLPASGSRPAPPTGLAATVN